MNPKARWMLLMSRLFHLAALLVVLLLVALTGYYIFQQWDTKDLMVSFYTMQTDKVPSNVRIVQLSDLHDAEFGKDNIDLVERVRSLKPDIIAITGDMNILEKNDYSITVSLVSQLSQIAPTYYSFGNHEYEDVLFYREKQVWGQLVQAGATVVNCTSAELFLHGQRFVIGGICVNNETFQNKEVQAFLTSFEQEEGFRLLLSHYPEIFEEKMDPYTFDLALAGHEHGGLINFPIIGPLYSEGQGFLPDLVEGEFTFSNGTLIISRGLGSHGPIPRINNEPDLVVVDLNWY